jgi:hypothetical protein
LKNDLAAWQPISEFVANESWAGAEFSALAKIPSATELNSVDRNAAKLDVLSREDKKRIERVVDSYDANRIFSGFNNVR